MMLLSRINRLEQRHTTSDALEALNDEELEEAVEANQSLAAAVGAPSEKMVEIPVDLDEQQLRALVEGIKRGQHG